MICPRCQSDEIGTIYTDNTGVITRRTHLCRNCGHKFKSQAKITSDFVFDNEKRVGVWVSASVYNQHELWNMTKVQDFLNKCGKVNKDVEV